MSLIPLGVLAASAAPVAAGSYDLLETYVVPSGGVASVSFTNLLATYGSTYRHLQIRYTARTSGSDTIASVLINYNNSTTGYRDHVLYGTSGVAVTSSSSANAFAYGGALARTNTTNIFGAGTIDILDAFSTSKNKVHRTLSGMFITANSFQNFVSLQSGLWANTAAINEITLTGEGSNFQEFSRFSLYGIKG